MSLLMISIINSCYKNIRQSRTYRKHKYGAPCYRTYYYLPASPELPDCQSPSLLKMTIGYSVR